MFHLADARFRSWLRAYAEAQPRSSRRLLAEVARQNGRIAEMEREREALTAELRDLQSALAQSRGTLAQSEQVRGDLEAGRGELLDYVATLETDRQRLLDHVARTDADRARLLAHVSALEGVVDEARRESARWLRLLPALRVRIPGGVANANRLRALRNRLLGR